MYIDEVIKTRRLDEGEPPTRYMIKEYSQQKEEEIINIIEGDDNSMEQSSMLS